MAEPAETKGSNEWVLTFKNLFLPVFCKQCGRRLLTEENLYFCPTCWEMSPRIRRPLCLRCGRPHPKGVGFMADRAFLCGPCASGRTDWAFRRVVAEAHYADAVGEAIRLFKFYEKRSLVGPLANLMAEAVERELDPEEYDLLVPVPLHRVRERSRGYNQSLLLAKELAPLFPRAVVDTSLARIRPTRTQSRLRSPRSRRDNVRGAFAVLGEAGHLNGRTALLIDDVVTTHGTVAECTLALLRAGVASVDVLAAALVTEPEHRGM